jgi:hypothetical protein
LGNTAELLRLRKKPRATREKNTRNAGKKHARRGNKTRAAREKTTRHFFRLSVGVKGAQSGVYFGMKIK